MDKLIEYWHQKNSKEQMILAVVAAACVLFLIYLLVVSPLLGWRNNEEKRYQQNRQELAEVKQLAAQVKANEAAKPSNGKKSNLSVLIDKSLRENDLQMRGFQPGSNQDARLRLENAAYPSLMQWLYDLEYRHGLHISELSLTPAQASGRLMVSVRVSQ